MYAISKEFRKCIDDEGTPEKYAENHGLCVNAIKKYHSYQASRIPNSCDRENTMHFHTLVTVAVSLLFENCYIICKCQVRDKCRWLVHEKDKFDDDWKKYKM